MTLSLPGLISALSMKPIPPMIARNIANGFAALAADSAAPAERPAEALADPVTPSAEARGAPGTRALDQRA